MDGTECVETKPDDENGDDLSGGAIAGIVIGVIVALTLVGGLIFFLLKKKASRPMGVVSPNVDAGGDAQTYI